MTEYEPPNTIMADPIDVILPLKLRERGWGLLQPSELPDDPCYQLGCAPRVLALREPLGDIGVGLLDGFLQIHSIWEPWVEEHYPKWGIQLLEKVGTWPCKSEPVEKHNEHQVWTWRIVEEEQQEVSFA